MDGQEISGVIVDVTRRIYEYLDDMQWVSDPPMGTSEVEVVSSEVKDDYAILQLDSRLSDPSGLMLKVDSIVLEEGSVGFTRYDEISKTIVVRPEENILRMIESGSKVTVVSDMKFLVNSIKEFYQRYGWMIRLPKASEEYVQPIFPTGVVPNEQQITAAYSSLSDTISYVWGAPGTGKTQFVLASCIRGCLHNGECVAVFAPTNNSVEQVLSGILKTFPEEELPKDIVRLGIPSRQFLKKHPEMCEDSQAQSRLDQCIRSINNLEEVIYERCVDAVEVSIEVLRSAGEVWDEDDLFTDYPHLKDHYCSLVEICSLKPENMELLKWDSGGFHRMLDDVHQALFERPRPATMIREYMDWSDADIIERIMDLKGEVESIRMRTTGGRIQNARIIAGTPHQFISRFRPRGSDEDGRMELDVDRIFLDEAGYCGLIQALSLFTNGVPIIMFGDHMQLPPVSELDDSIVRENTERGGRLDGAYLWNMSSLFSETLLSRPLKEIRRAYLEGLEPCHSITGRYNLTSSHRFASNLAKVLDGFVYRNGITGHDGAELRMECLDAVTEMRERRENPAEARAIINLITKEKPDPSSLCILTPYRDQIRLLKATLPKRYADCIMTVHGSQGREWDTVILSVADNRVESRDVPYRFTSSTTPMGMKVINTAVSRAKRRLIIVCDREFWISKDGELLAGLIRNSEELSGG